jgi:riboflavin synthase alpha subunit
LFTGIIEGCGRVAEVAPAGNLTRIAVEAPQHLTEGVRVGDSIAVNGGCLTVTKLEPGRFHFQAVKETLDRTALGGLEVGARVNLERALRAGARLDGHIVQGHVDGTGRVRQLSRRGQDVRLAIDCGPAIRDFLVEKGSVAIDGVSLTVAGVDAKGFDVALIPHTLEATTLGERRPGDRVNLEADVLAKYVRRYVERVLASSSKKSSSRARASSRPISTRRAVKRRSKKT